MMNRPLVIRIIISGLLILIFGYLLIGLVTGRIKLPTQNIERETERIEDVIDPDAAASDAALSEQDVTQEESLINPEGMTIRKRFLCPKGYTRVSHKKQSFAAFLEAYPLYKDGKAVRLYDGSKKRNQSDHAAVLKMDLVDGDLQQCADSVLRLYTEYFWKTGQKDKIRFHLADGTMCAYDASKYSSLDSYMHYLFAYASTLSMDEESKEIKSEQLQAGDILIHGGSPGHVVMVLDVCENKKGEKAFLLGQGYMPAQQFHVLKNPNNLQNADDPWYYTSQLKYPFHTPEYTFEKHSLKRPSYLQ